MPLTYSANAARAVPVMDRHAAGSNRFIAALGWRSVVMCFLVFSLWVGGALGGLRGVLVEPLLGEAGGVLFEELHETFYAVIPLHLNGVLASLLSWVRRRGTF